MNSFVTGISSVDGQDGCRTGTTEANHASEGEYDALNDETFGDPDKEDWEVMHKTLVRLEKDACFSDGNENERQGFEDDALDLHLSRFDFGDGDESTSGAADLRLGEDAKRMLIQPSIWDSPLMKQPDRSLTSANHQEQRLTPCLPGPSGEIFSFTQPPIRMLSVADLEKNIIQQQQQERINKETERHKKIPPGNQNDEEVMKTIKVPKDNPVQPLLPSAQMFPPPPVLNHQSRMPVGFLPYSFLPAHYSTSINNLAMHPGLPIRSQHNSHHKHHLRQRHNNIQRRSNNDEYSNLMSIRKKERLIEIQLNQVNSDTPYISDYYFTVYKERIKALKGNTESKVYKDNQLNHPLSQPKGHEMLHGYNRGRTISESQNSDQSPRTYTPLQFENSLGRLQYGSVTAPRKIIDMDIVGDNQHNSSLERLMQKRSRHILLLIESLFKVVLKMEDLKNPIAIGAILIIKEKREKELMAQQRSNKSQNVSISTNSEQDTFEDMLVTLRSGLTQDKVTLMLSVRKGKILLNRIFVLLKDHPYRWTLWSTVFSVIPLILKKERDDKESVLYELHNEFERHVQHGKFVDLLKLSETIGTENILRCLTNCKFLLSSVITILFQMEVLFSKPSNTVTPTEIEKWILCLELITGIVSKLMPSSTKSDNSQHKIKIDRENNIVQTVRVHLERFSLQENANDFLSFITSHSSSNDITKPSVEK